ncbi:hypothetical protein NECAME_15367 [Necator americanus]|uniref:Uncharacterized protein n=1 Tax=Necator americanus TaxID=51031 RepID=W2SI72_NECAM|nr:hypothetical protein NECAME_15367 [Necator americanus]ETN69349.1 hypothetical protein NECAME_15367 [Necator americanus]
MNCKVTITASSGEAEETLFCTLDELTDDLRNPLPVGVIPSSLVACSEMVTIAIMLNGVI